MPIYEYKCTKCKHVQEEIVSTYIQNTTCEKCSSVSEIQMSCPSIHFRGAGFYNTERKCK